MKTIMVDCCYNPKCVCHNPSKCPAMSPLVYDAPKLYQIHKFNFTAENCSHILESIFSLPPNQHSKKS